MGRDFYKQYKILVEENKGVCLVNVDKLKIDLFLVRRKVSCDLVQFYIRDLYC